jgi:predicted amidohydrolase
LELRLLLVQPHAARGKEEARARVERLLRPRLERGEYDLVVLPEYLMGDPVVLGAEGVAAAAEPLDGPWSKFFEQLAGEYGVYIVYTMYERNGNGKPYNTAVLAGPEGRLLVYRKTHLFDALGYRESSLFTPGEQLSGVVDVRGFRVGLAVCFELRYPEVFRHLALHGADLAAVPAGWYRGPLKERQLELLAAVRAHENVIYVAVAALYGEHYTGGSLVADPYTAIIAYGGHGEKLIEARISKEWLERARRELPLLELRRPSLYESLNPPNR